MFKLLGFIVGCAVSLGALVVVMGTPEFHFGDRAGDAERYQAAIEKLREKKPEPASGPPPETAPTAVEDSVDDSIDAFTANVPEEPEEPASDTATTQVADTPDPTPVEDATAPTSFDEETQPHTVAGDSDGADLSFDSTGWQAIWNPFRSEIAARGFVRRLEQVTGIDYRITKEQHGVYQVAFPYRNDSERDTRLAQIAAATGLDLGDPLP